MKLRGRMKKTYKLKGKSVTIKPKKKIFSELSESFSQALTPNPPMTVSEWADKYRMLPAISTHESGLWRTSRFPFTKRVMDLLSSHEPCYQIVVMKGAQLAFTEIALNWKMYTIHYDPGPMLYVQKTLDAIKIFMEQRFEPSVDEMPIVRERIGNSSLRKSSGDTARLKVFPGGMIRFGGANSASSLRSMPIERLMLDEEDSYESDIQSEGSPSDLAIRRTANFPRRKIYRISTPTIKETSVIEPLFEAGTKERYHVPCPFCGNMDWIRWANIKYVNDDPNTAELLCEACGCLIAERYKTQMLSNGKWIAENPHAEYPSFHISSLYSPYGFYSWKDAVRHYVKAIRNHDNSSLKTFVNTVLGETWSESGKTVKASWLEGRKEQYVAEVPKECMVLTCGADVQDDRIECEVVGWANGLESYGITYKIFRGDTAQNAVWEQFDTFTKQQFRHGAGMLMPITCVAVDSGHRTKIVYEFCRMREHRYFFPVKGDDGWGKGLIDRPRKKNKYKVWAFRAFVDEIKSTVYSYLTISEPGPGYCHFPNIPEYDTEFFRQLTSESLKKVWSQGKYRLRWMLPEGRRNEVLDCRCLNHSALTILLPDFGKLPINEPIILNQRPIKRGRRRHSKGVNS